jgi:hypothetical protein
VNLQQQIKESIYERAIPQKLRGTVWPLVAGIADIRKSKPADYFQVCIQISIILLSSRCLKKTTTKVVIKSDSISDEHSLLINYSLRENCKPHSHRNLLFSQQSLFAVLKGYSMHNPRVGYCQGMAFIAGVLLLHIDNVEVNNHFTTFIKRIRIASGYLYL